MTMTLLINTEYYCVFLFEPFCRTNLSNADNILKAVTHYAFRTRTYNCANVFKNIAFEDLMKLPSHTAAFIKINDSEK